jgi:hypothetical protein
MGQPSTIDLLPDDLRELLRELLADPRVTQLEIVERINQRLAQRPDAPVARLSKSALNRYAVRMNEIGRRLSERHEVAELWVGKFGRLPQGQLGQLIIQMVHGLAFDAGLKLSEGEGADPDDLPAMVRMLKDLAHTIEKTERAASLNAEREADIRRQMAAELAEQVGREAGGAVTPERLRQILHETYGV